MALAWSTYLPSRPTQPSTFRQQAPIPQGCGPAAAPCASVVQAIDNAGAGDTISIGPGTFTSAGSPTFNGDIEVTKDLTIVGSGARSTILNAGRNVALYDKTMVVDGGKTVTASGVTIANGFNIRDTGGIVNNGALTLNDSAVSGNIGDAIGGISNSGTLTLNRDTVSDNTGESPGGGLAGGLYNTGTATVNNSTVSRNTAGGTGDESGGGIANYGTLYLDNATARL